MVQKNRSRFWRKCRIYFRRFRITMLLTILVLLGAVIFLEVYGLPGFVQKPLLDKLRARGLDLDFTRLRMRWYRGLVAENVSFGEVRDPFGPRLTAKEVEIHLDTDALMRFQLQVDELNLRGGRLVWPVGDTNAPYAGRALAVEALETRLRLLPGDEWALDNFSAHFAGARFFVSGTVTNASAVRDWKFLHTPRTGPAIPVRDRLRQLADTLDRISFSSPPELWLLLDGDARQMQSFTARLSLNAPDADTPWGQATNVVLKARLYPGAGGELSHVEMNLQATDARTPWATASALLLDIHLDSHAEQTNWVNGDLTARATYAVTSWAAVTNAEFIGHWVHSLTNPIPLSGHGELHAGSAHTRWASGSDVRLGASLAVATNPPPADASWGWWAKLQPYDISWEVKAARADSEKLGGGKVAFAGDWRAPMLEVTNLHALIYDGSVEGKCRLDVATRDVQFNMRSDFDAQKIADLLPPAAGKWLAKFTWAESPRVQGGGTARLPAWTNRPPGWEEDMLNHLSLAGEFAVTNGSYLGIHADWARSHISFSNQVWRLPDLEASRPDGKLRLEHIADDKTHDYYFRIQSTVELGVARSLLSPEQQEAFNLFRTAYAPVIDGELWGRWHDNERIGFKGRVALTNFSFREQTGDSFVSEVSYTNRVLELVQPHLWRGTQVVTAARVAADFNTQRIFITNGFCNTDPMAVVRAIGPNTARHVEPYIFKKPPTVYVQGYAPMEDEDLADLHFNVDGGPFEWWKFKLQHIQGDAHWQGDKLWLTNVRTEFYRGGALGQAGFDFIKDRPGTDFNFAMSATNVDLQTLMGDLATHTNRLQGRVNFSLVITNANTDNMRSWNGYGRARLRNGLIWEIPIFGILSKPLDAALPGLGSTTVSEGSARFGITNGVIVSDDLEMRAAALRLQYAGTVDFDGRVNARIEAEPLRDAWVVGRVLSVVLWPVAKLFEYKVTGTLENPKTQPLYIPKALRAPFHPIQTLEDLFASDPNKTNAVPIFTQP